MTFKKGDINNKGYWEGKHLSKEHKKKISETSKGRKLSEETKEKMRGKNNHGWKGGKIIGKSGYIYIHNPEHPKTTERDPYIAEHILIAEKILGRFLKPEEVVHHIDGNKSNNKQKNLFVCKNRSDHNKLEVQLRKTCYECIKKGIIEFDKEKRKYYIKG